MNVPENVACTRAAQCQPVEVSPLELSVADQIRLCHDRDGHPSYNTHLRMYDAAPLLAAGVAPRLVHSPQHRMHIDYAHSITLGRNKEQLSDDRH